MILSTDQYNDEKQTPLGVMYPKWCSYPLSRPTNLSFYGQTTAVPIYRTLTGQKDNTINTVVGHFIRLIADTFDIKIDCFCRITVL